jgi:uncharacterized protein YhjY with autotransporter beta-barrel domain
MNTKHRTVGLLGQLALCALLGVAALSLPGLAKASPGCQALNGLSGSLTPYQYVQLLTDDQPVNQGDVVTLTTSGQAFYGGSFLQMLDNGGTVSGTESGSGASADNLESDQGSGTITYSITCVSVGATISSVSPSSGVAGSTVTITGTGLWGTSAVKFGSLVATNVTTSYGSGGNAQLTVTVPNGVGTVAISVVTDAGTYSGGTFTFTPPTANAVSTTVAYGSSNNPIALSVTGTYTAIGLNNPAHGTIKVNGLAVTYSPAAGYFGPDSFTYQAINNAGDSAPATVSITVSPPPAPTVSAASATTAYATATNINLASAITGSQISAVNVASNPSHGTVSVSGETVTYTPASTFYGGSDSFTYTATNPGGTSSPATVTITVNPPPTGTTGAATISTPYNTPASLNLASVISGADITAVNIASHPSHGTVSVSGETVTYTPASNFYGGNDSFTYTATNPSGTSAPATVSVTVGAVAVPAATAASATTSYDTATSINLASAVSGIDVTGINIASNPAHGTVNVAGEVVTYTPSASFYGGTDSFTYTASNPGGHSAPATVTITVTPLSVPTSAALSVVTTQGTSVLIDAAAEVHDTQPLTGVSVATPPAHGTASASGEQIVYTPAAGFTGTDSFGYRLDNHFGASAIGTITVTVTAPGRTAGVSQTVTTQPGSPVTVNLASVATGSYVSSALLGMSPANAGSASVSQPAALSFTPAASFHGLVQVTTVLIAANGQTQTEDVLVLVNSQPDPSRNPDVLGLLEAQAMQAERFAQAQLGNIQDRLDSLHDGNASARFSNNLSVSLDGKPLQGSAGTNANGARVPGQDPSSLASMRPGIGAAEAGGGAPSSAGTVAQGTAPAPQASSGLGTWIDGSANFGAYDAYRQAAGFDSDNIAVNTGVDQRIGEHGLLGISLGYNHDNSEIANDGTRSVAQGYSAALYGSYQPAAHIYLDGIIGGGGLTFDSSRYAAGSAGDLIGHRNGDQWFASLTAGYAYRAGAWTMSPYGRFAWSLSSLNGFSETGDVADALTYGAQALRTTQAIAGLRASGKIPFGDDWFIPHVRLEIGHDFQGTSDTALSYAFVPSAGAWNALSNPYTANGTTLQAAFGGDVQLGGNLSITTDYQYLLMPHAHDQGIQLGLHKQF